MSLCSAELGLRNSSTMFFIARNGGSEIKFLGRIPGRNLHLLDLRRRIASDKRRFRWVLGEIAPRLSITSSLYSFVSSGNVIAAAAACGAGSAHAAVTSALAHVAVTAVAIASGACLSTKVDFLWPRVEAQPDSLILDGVNVTGFPIFNEPKVLKAVAFARNAHDGQLRKTGDAYLTHCLHTGRILAALVPATGQRAIDTIVAGILHDVIDDACESLQSIAEEFGEDVAKLVAGVSRLSCINQLLRRRRSSSLNQGALGLEEANNLRVMLLGMVDDPRVVLIKLADRLHNMRTIYALSSPKANAVAQETLSVWCSLASRLGVWALKAELEDLCFAVLQPQTFHQMRAELASMWMENDSLRYMRQIGAKRNERLSLDQNDQVADSEMSMGSEDETIDMKDLLQAVLPFDLLLDRRKRSNFLSSLRKCPLTTQMKPKVVIDACVALASLADIEETLERELFISTSYVPGMEVTLSSRLKSLYSIFCKMKRKHVDIRHVYDARALRVVVGDKDGSLHGAAVRSCYSLLNTVHRLWTPIDGEFDDYIVNPKPSGYQSLHTAVKGPDGSPVEVQIRTERMHKYAEDGLAAHWLYKEGENKVQQGSSLPYSKTVQSAYKSKMLDDESSGEDEFQKFGSLKVGHPLLRVDGSHLLAAVTVRVDNGGRELLVAVSFELGASEAVADRRSFQMKRWEAYASLYKKVSDQWWFAPGHGDWCTCLEKYVLCKDGIYHKQDQFQRLLPTFIQVIDLTEREEADYWMVVSAVFEGKQIKSVPSNSSFLNRPSSHSCSLSPTEANINNKVLLLRTMLQWEEQVLSEAGLTTVNNEVKLNKRNNSTALGEVVIVCWPHGEIMRIKAGSTAADAARRVGLEGKLVLVNGQFTLPHTELKDGDIVEFRV